MRDVVKAKIFKNGGSQAIRIPAQWRFGGEEVFVRFDEDLNALVITERSPKPMERFFALAKKYGPVPDQDWPAISELPKADSATWLTEWLKNEK